MDTYEHITPGEREDIEDQQRSMEGLAAALAMAILAFTALAAFLIK